MVECEKVIAKVLKPLVGKFHTSHTKYISDFVHKAEDRLTLLPGECLMSHDVTAVGCAPL